MSQDYQLSVVTKAKQLAKLTYQICKEIPEEKYILVPQMCRAAISVPSNLVEGQQRGLKEFLQFIRIARGSLYELKIQLELAYEIYGFRFRDSYSEAINLIDEIGKMTYGLTKGLNVQITDTED